MNQQPSAGVPRRTPNPDARRILLISLCYLAVAAVLISVLVALTALCMRVATSDGVLTDDEAFPEGGMAAPYDCILVLGAGLKDDGTPSDMLADRVTTACELYERLGGIPIIMSGDHSGDYDEVTAMKALAVSLGVDSSDIFLDHKGYSTYESVYRAKETFGAGRLLIVTQEYHLYRAIFIARNLGMEADGVSADTRPYRGEVSRRVREGLARYKDMFLALRGEPRGDVDARIDLAGDGDNT